MRENEDQYYIYDKRTNTKVPVNKEFFKNYCRYIDVCQQKMEYHDLCKCPRRKRLIYCDTVCGGCKYQVFNERSLDEVISKDGDTITLGETIVDPNADVEDAIEKKEAEEALARELACCDEIGRKIIKLLIDQKKEVEIEEILGLTRGQYSHHLKKARAQLIPNLRDYFFDD